MFWDRHAGYPMDSFRRLHFKGILQREIFQKALAECIAQEPLFHSRVEKVGRNQLVWTPVETPPQLRWKKMEKSDFHESGFPLAEPLDLEKEAGFRAYVLEGEETTDVLFQFHHSTSDGTGEMLFIGDFLTAYAREATGNQEIPKRLLEPSRLERRGEFGWSLARYIRYGWDTNQTTMQFFFQKSLPLKPYHPTTPAFHQPPYPAIVSQEFSPIQTQRYIQEAKRHGVTLNDLLLRDFFQSLYSWQQKTLPSLPQGRMRISIPMNLRMPFHAGMPAANVVTMVFVDVPTSRWPTAENLLRKVHRTMHWIKTHDQRYIFNLILKVGKTIFGTLRGFLKKQRCCSTACLSNLGRVLEKVPLPRTEERWLRVGDATLESIDAAPPIRPGTMVSLSALTYASRLRLCLRYDTRFLTREDAETILLGFPLTMAEKII